MPGARFFFLSHVPLFVLPDGRERRAGYNRFSRKGRRTPHPPRRPLRFEPRSYAGGILRVSDRGIGQSVQPACTLSARPSHRRNAMIRILQAA
jgi:hypothetical protein